MNNIYKIYRRAFLKVYNLFLRIKLFPYKNFTLISNNCLGGIIYHDLNKKFCSPTINLWFSQDDFIAFCLYLDDFLNGKLEKVHMDFGYPYMKLISKSKKEVYIGFMHYKSYKEAEDKWYQRCKRITPNIIIIFEYKEEMDKNLLEKFVDLPYKKVIFCSKKLLNIANITFDPKIYDEHYSNSKLCFASDGIFPKKYYQRFNIVKLIKNEKIKNL